MASNEKPLNKPITISVVIPTLNRPKFLRQALTSILEQELPPKEIIVIDDASSAEFKKQNRQVCDCSPLVAYHRLDTNRGRSAARNYGKALATGKLIHFLDDDDLIAPSFYNKMSDKFRHCKTDVAICESTMFHNCVADAKVGTPLLDRSLFADDPVTELLWIHVAFNSCLFKAGTIKNLEFNENLKCGEDQLFLLNIGKAGGSFTTISDCLAFYRHHVGNTTNNNWFLAEQEKFYHILVKSGILLESHPHRFLYHYGLGMNLMRQRSPRALRHVSEIIKHRQYLAIFTWRFLKQLTGRVCNQLTRPHIPQPQSKNCDSSISVLIATYNRPETLFETVSSVLSQTLLPQEIIIVDDGSLPKHAARNREIAELSTIINYYIFNENKGRSCARNKALEQANGEFVHFLDDDDLIHSQFHEHAITAANESCADFTVCRTAFFFNSSFSKENSYVSQPFNRQLITEDPEMFILREPLAINSVLCRRSAIGNTRFDETLSIGEDTLFWLKLAGQNHNWKTISLCGAFVRQYHGNCNNSKNYAKQHNIFLEQLSRHSRANDGFVRASINLQLIRNNMLMSTPFQIYKIVVLMKQPFHSAHALFCFADRIARKQLSFISQHCTQFLRR